MTLEFQRQGERIVAVSVERPLSNKALYPTVDKAKERNVPSLITIPTLPEREEVRAFLRRVQSFLNMFGACAIDFNSEKVKWIPENKDEERILTVSEISLSQKKGINLAVDLTFDFVSGVVHSAYHSTDDEIPLSFVRRGRRDLTNMEYFSAFYNFFFYLETKYFPGYSDPNKIKKIISENETIINAIKEAKNDLKIMTRSRSPEKYLEKSVEEIINNLVDTRGSLHHHSKRGPANWHPEKPEEFEAEAFFLGHVVNNMALGEVISRVFFERDSEAFFKACEAQNAIASVTMAATEVFKDAPATIHKFRIRVPGKTVHMALLDRAHKEARKRLGSGRRFISKYDLIDDLMENKLGSGLINHSQKMTAAAMQIAEKKVWAQRS